MIEVLGYLDVFNNPDFNYGEFAIVKSLTGLNNPNFKPVEFDGFRKQADLKNFILV